MNRSIKYFTFLVILLCVAEITKAQEIDLQKSWITGGSIGFSTQVNNGPSSGFNTLSTFSGNRDSHSTYFNFTPYVGKEISRHWTLGLQMQYIFDADKTDDAITIIPLPPLGQILDTVDLKRNENQFGIGFFGRYVFNPDNKFMVFLQPNASFTVRHQVNLQDDQENYRLETKAFGVGASVGVLYELNEMFRLTSRMGLVGYTAGNWKEPETGDENNFSNFSTNLNLSSLFFGFEFSF